MNDIRSRNVTADDGFGHLEECSGLGSVLQRLRSAVRHAMPTYQY